MSALSGPIHIFVGWVDVLDTLRSVLYFMDLCETNPILVVFKSAMSAYLPCLVRIFMGRVNVLAFLWDGSMS